MPASRIDDIVRIHRRRIGSRLWAEWCFVRVCYRHFRVRFLLMLIVLLGGAFLFRALEPDKEHSFLRAMHMTFLLIWGEAIDDFPDALPLQILLFAIPVLGITLIIEGILDFALTLRDRQRFERSWCTMLAASFRRHVVVVGLGRLGYRTFLTLRRLGEPVVVIERDPNNQFLEDVRRDGSPVFIGDARREALLIDANVRAARSVVIATNDDLANLEIALDARKLHPDVHIVLRLFDQNMADKVRGGFSIPMAMSQSAISAPTFATSALLPDTVNSVIVDGELIAMLAHEVASGDAVEGMTVDAVRREFGIGVVRVARGDDPPRLMPEHSLTLRAGDTCLLQGPIPALERLRRPASVPRAT